MEEKRRLLEFRMPRTGEVLSFRSKQYYVSKDGQVWDDARKRYVPQKEMNNGYLTVALRDDEGTRHTSIMAHNLVATCFIRMLEQGEQVHHISHVKSDNRLENLEIITTYEHLRIHWQDGTFDGVAAKASERAKIAWRDGRFKTKNVGNSYSPAKQVAQLTKDGQLIKVWPSTAEAGRNGFLHQAVSACCNGKRKYKTHKGFKWMWYEDYLAQQPTVSTAPVQIELGN